MEETLAKDGLTFTFNNPVHQSASLLLETRRDQPVQLGLYDVAGRLVRSLQDGLLTAGRHEFRLSMSEEEPLASGMYFARLTVGDRVVTKKLVVVR